MIQALALVALAIWIAALANAILNLLLVRRLPAPGLAGGPLLSIVVPARNEERGIERTLRAFLAQRYRDLEVVVVNDRSTDQTGVIAERLAAGDSRLRVLHGEAPPSGWLGKPWALHQGARVARGELLLFVDADLVYQPEAVGALLAAMNADGADMATPLPFMEMRGFWEHVALPMLALAFFVMLPSWLGNRTNSVRLALGGGTGNLIRRRVYDAIGGHDPLRSAVVDDIGLARLVRRWGGVTRVYRGDHLVSLRMYHGAREIIDGFTKNMFAAIGWSYGTAGAWLLAGLVGSILPYVFALVGNPLAIAAVVLISVTRFIVFASLRYRRDNAVLAHPLMMIFWAAILVRSLWITGVKGEVSWRGRTYAGTGT